MKLSGNANRGGRNAGEALRARRRNGTFFEEVVLAQAASPERGFCVDIPTLPAVVQLSRHGAKKADPTEHRCCTLDMQQQ